MREEPLPEHLVPQNLGITPTNTKSLTQIIESCLKIDVGIKIKFDASVQDSLETAFRNFCPNLPNMPYVKKMAKTFAQRGEGIYGVGEKKDIRTRIMNFATTHPFDDDILETMHRRNILGLIQDDKDIWTEASYDRSIFQYLDINGSIFPNEWRFTSIKSQFQYTSKMFYQSYNSLTPLTVDPFDLGKLSILLPGSSPRFWRIFPVEEQIRLNDYVNHHREWKCASPLLHKVNFIDDEAAVKLNLKSFFTIQYPSDIIAIAPGSCYQTVSVGPTVFEEMLFYNPKVAVRSIERLKCKCVPVLDPMVSESHKDIRTFLGSVEMLNYEVFNGPKLEAQKLAHLRTKLSSTSTSTFGRCLSFSQSDDNDVQHSESRGLADEIVEDDVIVLSNGKDVVLPTTSNGRKGRRRGKKIPTIGLTVKQLEKRKSDKEYYKNLPPEKKKKKAERDIDRPRESVDAPAVFFKREIEKAQKRLVRIFKDIESHNDPSILEKPSRTLEELQNQQNLDELVKQDLIKDRERYNILKQIYCKSDGTLKANFLAGLNSEEIIRLFFDHTARQNVKIWNLAVELAIKSEDRQLFYKELIMNQFEWEAHFNIHHGFRIPWKEWAASLEEGSAASDEIIGSLEEEREQQRFDEDDIQIEYSNLDDPTTVEDELNPDYQNLERSATTENDVPLNNIESEKEGDNFEELCQLGDTSMGNNNFDDNLGTANDEDFIDRNTREAFGVLSQDFAFPTHNFMWEDDEHDDQTVLHSQESIFKDAHPSSHNESVVQPASHSQFSEIKFPPPHFLSDDEVSYATLYSPPRDENGTIIYDPIEISDISVGEEEPEVEKYPPTPDESAYVNDGIETIFSFIDENSQFTSEDLKTLDDGIATNDNVMNVYLKLVGKRSRQSVNGPKYLIGTTMCCKDGYQNIEDYKNISNLNEYRYFMAPVFVVKQFYADYYNTIGESALYVVDFIQMKCYCYSAGDSQSHHFDESVKNLQSYIGSIWSNHGKELDWKKFETIHLQPFPLQPFQDVRHLKIPGFDVWVDHSIFTMVFAEQLSRGIKTLENFNVKFMRKMLKCEIADGRLFHTVIPTPMSQDIFDFSQNIENSD